MKKLLFIFLVILASCSKDPIQTKCIGFHSPLDTERADDCPYNAFVTKDLYCDSCYLKMEDWVLANPIPGSGGSGISGGSDCSVAQCTGTTLQGDRCKNTTKNCSRRCYLH